MDVLWRPSPHVVEAANITAYRRWLEQRGVRLGPGYDDLWRWSVEDLDGFWTSIWDYYDVQASRSYDAVLPDRSMPGAVWFPGASLNYAQHALRYDGGDSPALLAVGEDGHREVSWTQLRADVAAVAARLRSWDVGPGDRVAGYLPNVPATGSSGTPRRVGSCGTSWSPVCCTARRSCCTTALRRTPRRTRNGSSPPGTP